MKENLMRQIVYFQKSVFILMIILLLFFAPFILCGVVYKMVNDIAFLQNSTETLGEVIRYDEGFDLKVKYCRVIVRFYTNKGDRIEFQASEIIGNNCHINDPSIGEKVAVLYQTTNPTNAILGTPQSLITWKISAILGLIVFCVFSIICIKPYFYKWIEER